MMRICISGLTGSGKTTLGNMLSKELKIEHITKEMAGEYARIQDEIKRGRNRRLGILQAADPKYARKFDSEILKAAKGRNCVVTTWLAPWLIRDATLRVWLDASLDERSRRKARDMRTGRSKAKKYVMEKDGSAAREFKKIYGIDISDHSVFDLEINTERLTHREAVAVISMLAMLRESAGR